MKKYKASNSRRFKRLRVPYLIKFEDAQQHTQNEPYISNLKDISAGGVRFWSEHFFPEDALVRVSIWFPPIEETVTALGRVVRVRRSPNAPVYYLSVRFVEIEAQVQEALNDFIEDLSDDREMRRFVDDSHRVNRFSLKG